MMDGSLTTQSGFPDSNSPLPDSDETLGTFTSDATFDQWIGHHLQRLYDPIAKEPIPADLLRLLESKLK